jgi:hypothetical protein
MSWRFLPVFLIFLAGCGKRAGTSATPPVSAARPTPGPEGSGEPATPAAASPSDGTAALGELTQALRKYSFEQRRVPKELSELIAAGYLKDMPQPPAGKKFGIDAKTVQVILVKQ